jgi:dTDP-4-amino-4,6-dideoxygalactose transaminase
MVVCATGTAALHLALEALQLPDESQVIVPEFAMVACPRAVMMAGLRPFFVDCGRDLLLDVGLLRGDAGVPRLSAALMAVHTYGRQCDMDGIDDVASSNDLWVVEDLAEAHGVRPHGGTAAACWSFYKNKIVAGEEGGAVWFRDPAHAKRARMLRSLGFTDSHDFWHIPGGHNYRLSNVHAELILESLARVHDDVVQRRVIEAAYEAETPREWRMPKRDAVWVYDVRVPFMGAEQQGRMVAALNEAGVRARHAFKPCSRQAEWRDSTVNLRLARGMVGEADRAATEVVYFPVDSRKLCDPKLALRVAREAV